jgi:hypothetical protein
LTLPTCLPPIQGEGEDGLAEGPLTECGPFLCYLTIDGLDRTDPRKLIALRGRIDAAARTAAEGPFVVSSEKTTVQLGS